MDLDGDGNLDVLSGSFSRTEGEHAGLFQVLWGRADGTWRTPTTLCGSDGKPLLITVQYPVDPVSDRVHTRPFAADLDGDGKLDLLAGNSCGMFALFAGQGGGRFAPTSTMLKNKDVFLDVPGHGDPMLVDLDRDGDLDLVSGGSNVVWFENQGTARAPSFHPRHRLLLPADRSATADQFGCQHRGPAGDLRVWVDDLDDDGKLDLLVGDRCHVRELAPGVDEATARERLAAWQDERRQLDELRPAPARRTEKSEAEFRREMAALEKRREAFVRDRWIGTVWVCHGR